MNKIDVEGAPLQVCLHLRHKNDKNCSFRVFSDIILVTFVIFEIFIFFILFFSFINVLTVVPLFTGKPRVSGGNGVCLWVCLAVR